MALPLDSVKNPVPDSLSLVASVEFPLEKKLAGSAEVMEELELIIDEAWLKIALIELEISATTALTELPAGLHIAGAAEVDGDTVT